MILHVSDAPNWGCSPAPIPTTPYTDLWWAEGESPEDGEFVLVRAPTAFAAWALVAADWHRQTDEVPDRGAWTLRPAKPAEIIAWWRCVQYPALDLDPEEEQDNDCDGETCRNCGHARQDCCLWAMDWAKADCDGEEQDVGVELRAVELRAVTK